MMIEQEGGFTYDCPHCNFEMRGDFGDNVYCPECDKSYETEWEYADGEYGMFAWLIEDKEYKGKVT